MNAAASWHAAASLRPRIRDHFEIHRHVYRGRRWHVLQDHASGRVARFGPEAHYVIGLMDGTRTLATIYDDAREHLGDDAPDPDDLLAILSQLHQLGAVVTERLPDTGELTERGARHRRERAAGFYRSPVAIRIPLFDPERLLQRCTGWLGWVFGAPGLVAWLVVVGAGTILAAMHWAPLTEDFTDRVLSNENLLLLFFVFPAVKALHEIGHALAVKRWGGEVHEMGVMLLVFIPIPYVDASASGVLRHRHQRALIGAAGMLVELFIAALAMIVWVSVEPGPVHAVAYNTMVIAGISTVVFNGNPLLRFDGYYILMDLLEIPNLGSKANRHLGALFRRVVLRQRGVEAVADDRREAWTLGVFGVASFAYRMFVLAVIVLLVAGKFFVAGVVLAAWVFYNAILAPLFKSLWGLLVDPALIGRRGALVARAAAVAGAVGLLLFALPLPSSTAAEGVVRAPDAAALRVDAGGFFAELLVLPGERVTAGQPIARLDDPVLDAQVALYRAQVEEAQRRVRATAATDRVEARHAAEVFALAQSRLADAERQRALLRIVSPHDGVLVLDAAPAELAGRFVPRGHSLGWVLNAPLDTVRVAVDMDDVDPVRTRTVSVEALVTSRRGQPLPASVLREVPAATNLLPSRALSLSGGGTFALDPAADGAEPLAARRVFQFDVRLAEPLADGKLEQRVFVKFRHPPEPLAQRAYRALRRLLLARFDV